MRVLRVYHAGRDFTHRARERALAAAGVELSLVAPAHWPGTEAGSDLSGECFAIHELRVKREGDVNRHAYADGRALERLIQDLEVDLLDVHEEPFSVVGSQWISVAPRGVPVVMYTAQNIDKRYPPPFAAYERRAHGRAAALYPCSRQAAAVARGKGFARRIEVIPLGFDPTVFYSGDQSLDDEELVVALSGRLVPEKGIRDAVRVFACVSGVLPARLIVMGSGPEEQAALGLAEQLGVRDRLEVAPWQPSVTLAAIFRQAHVVLVPSISTATWAEQFGRVIVEAQASGAVVAGYACGAIREVAGSSALLAAEGDVGALGRSVVRVLADPDEFARRRDQGINLSATRTWNAVARQHVALYDRAIEGSERLRLPRSPRRRRIVARAEFGETASTPAGQRPFALPLLRRGGALPTVLGILIDAVNEAVSLLRS